MKSVFKKCLIGLTSSLFAACVMLPVPLWAQTFTQEEQNFIENAGPVTLRFFSDQLPYSYVTKDGTLSGISVDVMKKISDMSGLSFEYEVLDQNLQVSKNLQTNPDDLIVGVPEDYPIFNSTGYVLSNPYFSDSIALVCHRNSNFVDPAAVNSYVLAIPRIYVDLESYIRVHYPHFTIVYCRDIEEGLDMVLCGNADFLAQNMTLLLSKLSHPRYSDLMLMPSLFMDEQMCVVGINSFENQMMINIINACLAALPGDFITEVTLQHAVQTIYRIKIRDVLYIYRVQIFILLVLLGISLFFMISWLKTRDRNYSELEKMNSRLVFAMEQANEAAQAKTRFLLRISHDIRTPMNAIVGSVDVAEMMERRNDLSLEKRLHIIGQVRNAAFSMEKLVDDVINRANALEGVVELHEQPFDLGSIVSAMEKELKMSVSGKVNWISASKDPSLDRQVIGDKQKFSDLMDLLIEDIICFPFPLRSLNISARYHDFGEGVVYCHLKTTLVSGISIGREIEDDSRRIPIANMIDVLGGAISYDVYNDICYDLSVTVPFRRSSEKHETDYDAESGALSELMNFKSSKKLRMLVVDDNEINVRIAQHILEACKIDSDAVFNGREAVDIIEASKPGTYDAVLMDIRMPVMNGNEATRTIRRSRHPDGSIIPIYAFSANYATTDISASINAGVDGYLKKPLEVQKLVKMLNSL